mmetsp:Transcript_8888/g.15772  ORF Transcript_8888/g.15772 Transcript_8888/m.15772 type:complete len:206 (+) Transcript_8888:1-618(+)
MVIHAIASNISIDLKFATVILNSFDLQYSSAKESSAKEAILRVKNKFLTDLIVTKNKKEAGTTARSTPRKKTASKKVRRNETRGGAGNHHQAEEDKVRWLGLSNMMELGVDYSTLEYNQAENLLEVNSHIFQHYSCGKLDFMKHFLTAKVKQEGTGKSEEEVAWPRGFLNKLYTAMNNSFEGLGSEQMPVLIQVLTLMAQLDREA